LVNKNVLSCLLKDGKEVNAVMLVGRLFHARATVLCWHGGQHAAALPAALRRASPQRIRTHLQIISYRIAILCLISYRIYRFLLWLYRAITKTHRQILRLHLQLDTILLVIFN